jgi:hypothetical protein
MAYWNGYQGIFMLALAYAASRPIALAVDLMSYEFIPQAKRVERSEAAVSHDIEEEVGAEIM